MYSILCLITWAFQVQVTFFPGILCTWGRWIFSWNFKGQVGQRAGECEMREKRLHRRFKFSDQGNPKRSAADSVPTKWHIKTLEGGQSAVRLSLWHLVMLPPRVHCPWWNQVSCKGKRVLHKQCTRVFFTPDFLRWFWFHFLWWVVMLSTFSFTRWPFVYIYFWKISIHIIFSFLN